MVPCIFVVICNSGIYQIYLGKSPWLQIYAETVAPRLIADLFLAATYSYIGDVYEKSVFFRMQVDVDLKQLTL